MKFLKWIWQFPQNIIGFLMSRKPIKTETVEGCKIYYTDNVFGCGVCLGDYILLDYASIYNNGNIESEKHEIGHQKQSLCFGPLYLIIVGLPSVIRNRIDVWFHKKWSAKDRTKWYYSSWPENDADKRGGVKRDFA